MNTFKRFLSPKLSKFIKKSFGSETFQQQNSKCSKTVEEFGQPTYWTHPHLFRTSKTGLNNYVTPGLSRQEFAHRRHNYATCLLNYQEIYFSQLTIQEKSSLVESPFRFLNPLSNKCIFVL